MALLHVDQLATTFFGRGKEARILRGLDFAVNEKEIVGLVGESGSGKSVTGLSILRLLPKGGTIVGGRILFQGQDLVGLSEKEMIRIRGAGIAMVFQNPRESLNPLLTVGDQLALVYRARGVREQRQHRKMAALSLRELQMPDAQRALRSYPHELSGGMCQRVMIALALACSPRLLIADEATTGLDVTVQLQIIEILKALRESKRLTELIITHDLGVVAELCDRVAVMYAGEIVELGQVNEVFAHPTHPYTIGLLAARPKIGIMEEIASIPGRVPDFLNLPPGCAFRPRCSYALEKCASLTPHPVEVETDHHVACFLCERSASA